MAKNNRNSGNSYERKICNELNELGFNTKTSRSESKNLDNDKVDIVDMDGTLPNIWIQIKKTVNTPSYFAIREASSKPNEEFIVLWNKQVKKTKNFGSEGEAVIMDKSLFYKFLKLYKTVKDDGTISCDF